MRRRLRLHVFPNQLSLLQSLLLKWCKMFQRITADVSLPWAVWIVAFTCSLLALTVLCAIQSTMFGIVQIVTMPDGERVLIGKAKENAIGLVLEHFVLPLSGVLGDDGLLGLIDFNPV